MTVGSSSASIQAGSKLAQEPRDTYVGPTTDFEYLRLRRQHDLVKNSFDGKLILADVDLTAPGLRIIDSATADGYFLVDLVASYPELASNVRAEYYAADLRPSQIMSSEFLPPRTTRLGQDISQPWPDELHGTFDLVSQRFVLANVPTALAPDAVAGLWSLVKPGGWLQLIEGDMYDVQTGPKHAAMERFVDLTRMLGNAGDVGPRACDWLRNIPEVEEAGVQVHTRTSVIRFGKMAIDHGESAEMAASASENIVDIVRTISAVALNFPAMANVDFAGLEAALSEELATVGNRWMVYAVWAQKPKIASHS